MIDLPQELLDAVIDQVDDRPTLHSCALVSHAFLAPSQRNIFHSLYIGRRRVGSAPGRLRAAGPFFTDSPHLALYVRNVTIDMPGTPQQLAAWTTVLSMLQGVLGSGQGSLIAAATAVPIVSFFRVDVPQIRGDLEDECKEGPRLRHLMLTYSGLCELLLRPRDPSFMSRVERLELRVDAFSRGSDERLLAACAPTLTHLTLDAGALTQPLNIPHLPLVRVLKFKVFVDHLRCLSEHFPATFARLAAALPLVEHIHLSFIVEPLFPEVPWPAAEPLPVLGPTFKDRSQLLYLQGVHCTIPRRNALPGSMESLFRFFVPAVETRMPGLQGTGILKCALTDPLPSYVLGLP
ncbi:hypothetical protein FB45DRAFT_1141631 [Roridomyces roridus]|uniref:F-box domain-containing protein n=1 Tax=Roridomyces roridus TaxID=1738132 RepID=A0AAD7BYZ6_9AGAR|nr:hypothetical protein FB45DRAFT_1141631 [Roridomyces roridus]